jgi:hypothetical protein
VSAAPGARPDGGGAGARSLYALTALSNLANGPPELKGAMIAGGAARAIGMALARWERAPGAWRSEGAQALQLLARLSRPSGGTRAHHAALVERSVVEGVVAAHARSLRASAAAAHSADAAARNCVLVLGNLAREDDTGRRAALVGWGAARALAAAADRPPVHCRPARIESSSAPLERARSS